LEQTTRVEDFETRENDDPTGREVERSGRFRLVSPTQDETLALRPSGPIQLEGGVVERKADGDHYDARVSEHKIFFISENTEGVLEPPEKQKR
jgi:hypothetical protein